MKDLEQLEIFLKISFRDSENLTAVTYPDLREWIIHLMDEGLSATSVNRKISSVRKFFHFLCWRGTLEINPAAKLQNIKKPTKTPVFVKEKEFFHALTHAQLPANEELIILLLYGTGMRVSELLSLTYSSIDLESKKIRILGKRNKERYVPIHPVLFDFLRKNLQFDTNKKDEKIVLTKKGKPAYSMYVYGIVKQFLGATSVSKKSPHVLRHTFATHLLNHGADLNAIKDVLGHSSLAATQIYTHNSLKKLKDTFDKYHPKSV